MYTYSCRLRLSGTRGYNTRRTRRTRPIRNIGDADEPPALVSDTESESSGDDILPYLVAGMCLMDTDNYYSCLDE
jgi:hypothetical protein